MKKRIFIFLCLAISILGACKKNSMTSDLGIAFHEGFEQDKVQVLLDTKLEFNKQITTNHSLGYADGFSTTKNHGIHTLKVVLNNTIIKT